MGINRFDIIIILFKCRAAKYIVKKESWRGLFKGLSVNWMRSPIATGLSLTAYDALKELMDVEPII